MNSPIYKVSLAEGADVDMTPEQIAAAHRAGTIKASTLIWREGLDKWCTLEQLGDEIGVDVKPQFVKPGPRTMKVVDMDKQPARVDPIERRNTTKKPGMSLLEKIGVAFVLIFVVVIFSNWNKSGTASSKDLLDTTAENIVIGAARSPKSCEVVVTERKEFNNTARREGYVDGPNAFGVEVRQWWWIDFEKINGKWQPTNSSVLQ